MFDDFVRTVVWLFQKQVYCILSYKDMGAAGEIIAHKRSLFHVVMGWSSLQFRHRFLEPGYVGTLIYGVASYAVEEFGGRAQGSAIHQFYSNAMKIVLKCHAYAQ